MRAARSLCRNPSWVRAACAAALALLASSLPASAGPFDECARALRADPTSRSAAECFTRAAVAASDAAAETEGRMALCVALLESGRQDLAWSEAPRIVAAARRSGNNVLIARALMYEPWLAFRTGERLASGLRVLQDVEPLIFPDGPYATRQRALELTGNLSYELGRFAQALAYFSKALDLAREHRDAAGVVMSTYNVIATRRKQMEELPEAEHRPELVESARRLVADADALAQPRLQAMAHRTLGDLLWPAADTREGALQHQRLALEYARRSGDAAETATCLWVLGRALAGDRAAESRQLVDEALRLALDANSGSAIAYAWRQQMRLAWKALPRERATADSLLALDGIETLAELQRHEGARAGVLSAWTLDYYWLMGQLLNHSHPSRADVALAFATAERMRARQLLESLLRQSGRDARAEQTAGDTRRRDLLRAISQQQRTLLDPRVQGAAREAATRELERLEREEDAARADLPPMAAPASAPLDEVERALGEDEAMLSFSVGIGRNFYGEFAGGAWLLVVTAAGTRVVSIPDRAALHPMISIFRGLAEAGKTGDSPAVRLHQLLLRAALDSLPKTVRRLILVPDGPLHHLPFAALRREVTAEPLGITHELSVVPSATVWMRLKQHAPLTDSAGALVFADPAGHDATDVTRMAQERGWSIGVLPAGSLPHSRSEGRAIAASLPGRSRLLVGAEATEAAMKSEALGSYAIVHFATHALVDDANPERSAIVLGGDAQREDGLLQAREIVELPLAGRIVVLSACRSATGAVLAGEGVMGLSRSFFEAGARTVIGTLWAIRDDHAALFFDLLYASLGRGHSIGSAMQEARRQAAARGLPASVWASVVAIGDDTPAVTGGVRGNAAARGPTTASATTLAIAALVGALLVIAALAARRRRVRRPAAR